MPPKKDDRSALIASLLKRAHEQSNAAPERSPFWREGSWRCEYHRGGPDDTLKVFRGERCVHEEVVEPGPRAHARSQELRRSVVEGGGTRKEDRPPE